MELKQITVKLQGVIKKNKYAIIILLVGIFLLLIPGKSTEKQKQVSDSPKQTISLPTESTELSDILQSIEGAGKVRVMLSVASSDRTQYVTNTDISENGTRTETVIITDANRNETGLIKQIDQPQYRGAIVVCQGADSAQVRLSITQAVSKITGLSTDSICVLKMK